MMCPRCELSPYPLEERVRSGVKVDWCAQCKGIWLDRGELEKLIAIESGFEDDDWGAPPPRSRPPQAAPPHPRDAGRREDDRPDDYRHKHDKHYKKKKKKNRILDVLEDLFD